MQKSSQEMPEPRWIRTPADVAGFEVFTERYKKGLPIERAAVESLK